jgi:hypothetical protein
VAGHFDPDGLRRAAREMAAEHGVERMPGQWEAEFRRLIASYRAAARAAGRIDIADAPDRVVWDRIRRIAGCGDG